MRYRRLLTQFVQGERIDILSFVSPPPKNEIIRRLRVLASGPFHAMRRINQQYKLILSRVVLPVSLAVRLRGIFSAFLEEP